MSSDKSWVLVAGGSGGIGAEICTSIAKDGNDVLIGYHSNQEAAKSVAERVRSEGRAAEIVRLDLGDADAMAITCGEITSAHALHGVIYTAGPSVRMDHMSGISPVEFAAQLESDAIGFYRLIQPLIPHLRGRNASVVAVTTAALARYSKKDLLSTAPKAAVQAVVKAIALEEGRFGTRANCVSPGILADGMFHDLVASGGYTPAFVEAAKKSTALGRLGNAADIAEAVAFFVSPRSGWITGQTLNVDGGYAL